MPVHRARDGGFGDKAAEPRGSQIEARMPRGRGRPRVTRRGIQITLGWLWILDGLLQFQPAMLTRKFATQVIMPAGDGQPVFVSAPVGEVARIILHQPAVMDVFFGLIQVAIGVGMLHTRTVRYALATSVVWASLVWYLGEGLGGLFGGDASLLTGAPGSALVYAVLAIAVWPRHRNAEDQRPAQWTAAAWAVLWVGGAVLQVLPRRDINASISMSLAMNASGAPAWAAAIDNHLSALLPGNGVAIAVDLVVLQILIGLGVLMAGRARFAAIVVGIAVSLVYWVAGQDMGGFWSGVATDPNTAPLIVLLGVAALGSAPLGSAKAGRPTPAAATSGANAGSLAGRQWRDLARHQ
jgi:hypothetical protein